MKKSRRKLILVAVILLLMVLGTATYVYAKYATSRSKETSSVSSDFHFSSNYLTESGATWTISDWGNGFDIELNNYEIENLANVSAADITYSVTVTDGWIYSVDGTTKTSYTLKKTTGRNSQTLHLTPRNSTTGGSVTVTVTTSAPYKKTLSATFTVVGKKVPDYTIENQGDGSVLITLKTNDYSGTETIKWDSDKYIPDNTNELARSFYSSNVGADGLSFGTFSVESNSTYQMLFLTSETVTNTTGTGTTITLE